MSLFGNRKTTVKSLTKGWMDLKNTYNILGKGTEIISGNIISDGDIRIDGC